MFLFFFYTVTTDFCLFTTSLPFLLRKHTVLLYKQLFLVHIFQQKRKINGYVHHGHSGWNLTEPRGDAGAQITSQPRSQVPSSASFSSSTALAPGTVQQFHLSQSLCDHSSKHQPKEDTAYQHVVVVVFQDIKLL